jgi:serine protease Do
MVTRTPPGTRVPIVFYRNGRQQTVTVTIDKLEIENTDQPGGKARRSAPGFGVTLGDLTPDIGSQLRLPSGIKGALVENVEPFTPASSAGIKRGDVMLEVNRQAVHSAGEASRDLQAIPSGQPAFVLLSRQGVQQFIELRKE